MDFWKYYRNYTRSLADRLDPLFQFLKTNDAEAKILINQEILEEIRERRKALDRCCQMAPCPPLRVNT